MRAVHVLFCLSIATASEQRFVDPREFIASQPENASLWSLQGALKPDINDIDALWNGVGDSRKFAARTFLFVAEPHRTRLECCDNGRLECPEYESGEALAVHGILENKDDRSDDSLSRWCLRADGTVDSWRTRQKLFFQHISPAPTLRELATKSTGEQCRPITVRYSGFFKSARELLCFAQGYRPAAVLQRLVHDRAALHGTINYHVTKFVASPYERAILTWLLSRPKDVVWRGTSRIDQCEQWAAAGECDKNPEFMLDECSAACSGNERDSLPGNKDLRFHESVVLSRTEWTGRELVKERVQDQGVPFAAEPEKRIDHCTLAGRLLGYPVKEINEYLRYDLDGGVPGATDDRVSQAIDSAHRKIEAAVGPKYADFEVGSHQLPPIDGVDELLDMRLDGSSLIHVRDVYRELEEGDGGSVFYGVFPSSEEVDDESILEEDYDFDPYADIYPYEDIYGDSYDDYYDDVLPSDLEDPYLTGHFPEDFYEGIHPEL